MAARCSENLPDLLPLKTDLIAIAADLGRKGWTPATSGNFSARIPGGDGAFLVSVSGKDKKNLTLDDFLVVERDGTVPAINGPLPKPSAETLLHAAVYRNRPEAAVVLHTHSVGSTVLSKRHQAQRGVRLENFEMLKGLAGITRHDTPVFVPIFENSQEMEALSKEIEAVFRTRGISHGFLLAGHGLYVWGNTLADARRHGEVFEFLFDCLLAGGGDG